MEASHHLVHTHTHTLLAQLSLLEGQGEEEKGEVDGNTAALAIFGGSSLC